MQRLVTWLAFDKIHSIINTERCMYESRWEVLLRVRFCLIFDTARTKVLVSFALTFHELTIN